MPCKSIRVWHMTVGVSKNRLLSIRNAAMQAKANQSTPSDEVFDRLIGEIENGKAV